MSLGLLILAKSTPRVHTLRSTGIFARSFCRTCTTAASGPLKRVPIQDSSAPLFVSSFHRLSSTATMSATNQLKTLLADVWDWHLKDAPEFASAASVHDFDDQLESHSVEAYEKRRDKCSAFLSELLNISLRDLSKEDQASFKILKEDLSSVVDGYEWRTYSAFNPVNFIDTIPNEFSSWIIDSMTFKTEGDYEKYLTRISLLPKQISEMIDLMKVAIEKKTTLHRCSIEGVLVQFQELIDKNADESTFYDPFKTKLMKITGMTSSTKNRLCQDAVKMIDTVLKPAFKELREFIETSYLPNTRATYGVSGLPRGEDYYRACLRWHLSTDMTPEEVHRVGLEEVARIRRGMEQVMKEVNFNGQFSEFLDHLKTDKQFYFKSSDELLKEYEGIIRQFIAGKLGDYFGDIPSQKTEIRPMPFSGPGGMYNPPSYDGERPGVFYVNLHYPDTVPKFSMMVLALHEASPGHHLQAIYALDRKLPIFRRERHYKTYAAPFFMPTYTCYVEGWACYAEYLGVEMKAYRTPYERFGRYSDEMMRAARLVVDTGLHMYGWSRDKCVQYMKENTCLPGDEVEEEINRYMMWPGQACGYKIGEIKIRELRKMAEDALGIKFDIKKFHEVVLALGPAPLYVLEEAVKDWINTTK